MERFKAALEQGEVILYPTEGIWGIGCDPNNEAAIKKIIDIKKRDSKKGLILIAETLSQLEPFIALDQKAPTYSLMLSTWPGPVTWLVPVKAGVSPLLTGQRDTLAVRVSNHPVVRDLCRSFGGPLVSTSANMSGEDPILSHQSAKDNDLGISWVVPGETSGFIGATPIYDWRTGEKVR